MNEDLRDWFGKGGKGGVGGGGWDRYNTQGERVGKCAREPGEPKPKCLSKEKASKMSKSQISSAVKRKRKKDPVADRSGKGGKPKMVSNKIDERIDYADNKTIKKFSDEKKKHKEQDSRMKYGKRWKEFTRDAESAKNRLKPGEVKRYDKKLGRWVSNKE